MLTRIVKLHFQAERIDDFLAHFETIKLKVAQFPGCRGMKLLRGKNDPFLVFTYSHWENEESLESYRTSELFQTLWPKIKPWFDQKPEAWSVETHFDGFDLNP
ncbi:MAG: putative quinol monooxygenase [Bacteroidota bacterium]